VEERLLHHRFLRGEPGTAASPDPSAQGVRLWRDVARDDPARLTYASFTAVAAASPEARPAAEPRMFGIGGGLGVNRAVDGFPAPAYRKAMARLRCLPKPTRIRGAGILAFFTLEKAIYEVSYELANRPGWVDIPLKGRARALGEDGGGPSVCCGGPDPQIAAIVEARHTRTRSHFSECTRRPDREYTSERCCRAHRICGWSIIPRPAKVVAKACPKSSVTVSSLSQQFPDHKEGVPLSVACCRGGGRPTRILRRLFFSARSWRDRHSSARRGQPPGELPQAWSAIRWYIRVSRVSPLRYGRRNAHRVSVVGDFQRMGWPANADAKMSAASWELFLLPGLRPRSISTSTRSLAPTASSCRSKADPQAETGHEAAAQHCHRSLPSPSAPSMAGWAVDGPKRWERNDRQAPHLDL